MILRKVLHLTISFEANRFNMLTVIGYEKLLLISAFPLPLVSIFFTWGKESALTEQMDEFSDCFQETNNRSANMLGTHFGQCPVLSGVRSRGKQLKAHWL